MSASADGSSSQNEKQEYLDHPRIICDNFSRLLSESGAEVASGIVTNCKLQAR